MDINKEIKRLISYGIKENLIAASDINYTINRILDVLNLDDFQDVEIELEDLDNPQPILDNILEFAYKNEILEEDTVTYRDLLDTKLMDCLMPRPSEIIKRFYDDYKVSPPLATKNYYNASLASNYIRRERSKRDLKWKTKSSFGELEITINLSKPEKDPKAIAAAKGMKSTSYPKCLLCKENEGYRGRINHPARHNHRIIPLTLNNEEWFLQFSPYVYYNEHSIIFKTTHEPMKITGDTFVRLMEFVEKFPHYFIGSNADLPIVGGSILSHDHFQGGNYQFPMEKAQIIKSMSINNFEDVEVGILKWPLSVIRIRSQYRHRLVQMATIILEKWRGYNDEAVEIIAFSNGEPHNTITPIGRFKNNKFEMDLVLRNNRTNEEHPFGIFHPHIDLHHIKKENIGLIEAMGLAVLPPRLKVEVGQLKECLEGKRDINLCEALGDYTQWFAYLQNKYYNFIGDYEEVLKEEIGFVFERILLDAGVFKQDKRGIAAFETFISTI